ncbi:MAG: 16S rRNA (cytosine1402-N4)-methyltransferase [Candidatus Peregrinibacteria bacterium Greene0416_62]|nr:MAG: 16S rRNA (cytosine1402-N4)-methyltransferase [Candidatus Peregrinibacteria bacterium Greene0416_62]TSC99225.1 MAG: 16S rRNA (cytosine1402-N4)-methyltransferase [Candidatus Peregrinibacteria bacterium Greene1014_49]
MHHQPVLLRETMNLLSPKAGESICDVTLGLGGHASALLKKALPGGVLIGLDADPINLKEAGLRLEPLHATVELHHANFRDLAQVLSSPVDIIFADLGVSSPHFDDPERGFSFRNDGPLDLRFDQTSGIPAFEWIAQADQEEIAQALRDGGELRSAWSIADSVLRKKPTTTKQLQECVEEALGWRATAAMAQVFQAFRIAVNAEMQALQSLLAMGSRLLNSGGRFGVISYHSLEDRLVKQAFRALVTVQKDPHTGQDVETAMYTLLTKKAVTPSAEEILENPRARSAKLRVIQKTIQLL